MTEMKITFSRLLKKSWLIKTQSGAEKFVLEIVNFKHSKVDSLHIIPDDVEVNLVDNEY
jgi:hypothetical protein